MRTSRTISAEEAIRAKRFTFTQFFLYRPGERVPEHVYSYVVFDPREAAARAAAEAFAAQEWPQYRAEVDTYPRQYPYYALRCYELGYVINPQA